MARKTPTVHDGKLTWPDGPGDRSITVGTPEWHAWLANAKSFRFVTADSAFTACKDHYRRGWYWRAYLHRSGKVHNAYIGKEDALTYDRLNAIAASLASRTDGDVHSISVAVPDCQQSPSVPLVAHYPDGLLQFERRSPSKSTMGPSPPDLLLATKLSPPPTKPELVMRPRLLGLMSQALKRQLTLVMAPPGAGKTTLLSQWVLESKYPIAWVSLDGSDNDPARFWAYVIAALQTLFPHLGDRALALLRSSQTTMQSVLEVLIGDLEPVQQDFALVLDDYHVVESQPVRKTVSFFLDHLPRCMHLIIATRSDPPLPMSRLRVNGQLTEVRAVDLSFTLSEADSFLNEVMRLGLTAEQVEALKTRTEGWIAGLQLAALSLQGCGDVGSFIEAFAGDCRYVMDYLMEEVFANQPPDTQRFLLQTSILDRLSGPLCNAVTGGNNGQKMLESLELANLLTVPFDDRRLWYRYHHLFSEFLQSVLHRQHCHKVPQLHRRASNWYAQNGLVSKAVDHALAAGEPELAAQLIEQDLMPMLRRGELTMFKAWMMQLPEAVVRSRPRLRPYHAWMLTYSLQLDAAERSVRETECFLADGGNDDTVESQRLRAEVLAMRAILAARRGDDALTITLSNQALEVLPEDNPLRGDVTVNLVLAYRLRGDVAGASRRLSDGSIVRQADGTGNSAAVALCELADLQAVQGRLRQAASTYRLAFKLDAGDGRSLFHTKGKYLVGMGRLLYEWNDLEAAMHHATKCIELGKEANIVLFTVLGHMLLARLKQTQGDVQGALDATVQDVLAGSTPYARLIPSLAEYRARLWLMQGRLDAAEQWAESAGLKAGDELSYRREAEYMTLARLRIAQGRTGEAVDLLHRLLRGAESEGRMGRVIKILALRALALEAAGNVEGGLESLARALALAEPEGYVRTFVDESAPMAVLLTNILDARQRGTMIASRPVSATYVRALLVAFNLEAGWRSSEKEMDTAHMATAPAMAKGSPPVVTRPLIESLSERELEVLHLLAVGASNQEIARRIVVTVSTVKKHANNIYGKLGVHSRTLAVARGRVLGILS